MGRAIYAKRISRRMDKSVLRILSLTCLGCLLIFFSGYHYGYAKTEAVFFLSGKSNEDKCTVCNSWSGNVSFKPVSQCSTSAPVRICDGICGNVTTDRTEAASHVPLDPHDCESMFCYNSSAPCRWWTFRQFYTTVGYFPSEGHWELMKRGFPENRFVPKMCRYEKQLEPEALKKCIIERKWHKFVTLGDSNGYRYWAALLYWLELTFSNCTMTKHENYRDFIPDVKYFIEGQSIPQWVFKTDKRDCGTCESRFTECWYSATNNSEKKFRFILEHLGMGNTIDTSLKTKRLKKHGSYLIPHTETTQEYYFKAYLKDRYPDVLLVLIPLVHEMPVPVSKAYARIELLKELILQYIPKNVKVVWVPQLKFWRFGDPVYDGLTGDEKNRILNKKLFSVVKPLITDANSNWYGFYDLQGVGCPLPDMAKDNLHHDNIIYRELMSHLLTLLCQSNK